MASGKVIGGLVAIAALGIAVAASSGEQDHPLGPDEDVRGGMTVSDDCQVVTVVDAGDFVEAWIDYAIEVNANEWFDADERADHEQLLTDFLRDQFPECFPPIDPETFVWITTEGGPEENSWDEVIDRMMEAAQLVPEGFEGAPEEAPADLDAIGEALAYGPEAPGPKIPVPEDLPVEPDGPEATGEPGAGGDVAPDNVVYVATPETMSEAGVGRAIDPSGTVATQRSAVFLVYDPEYPDLDELVADVYDLADEEPDVLFLLASSHDTQAQLGWPELLGTFGFAINASSRTGRWLYLDGAIVFDRDVGPPTDARWDAIVGHATTTPAPAGVVLQG